MKSKIESNIGEIDKKFLEANDYIREISQTLEKIENCLFEVQHKKIYNELEKEFKKYEKFLGIERFCIPIIGLISSGKSTFLNYLLNIECLESKFDITTKCVVIIRHNKSLEFPEIYSVKFKQRKKGCYNFEKNEKLYPKDNSKKLNDFEIKEDLKNIISKKNNFISNATNCPQPENFFILVETKIPLFLGENEKYAKYFEFMDLPGLDEGKNNSNDFRQSKFFKDNILPKIINNTKFSLFLFDAERFLKKNDIFDSYIQGYFKDSYYNSFFILNKVDILGNFEKETNNFKNLILKEKLKIDVDKCFVDYISAINLENESKKGDNFNSYLKYCLKISSNESIEKSNYNFIIFLRKQLEQDYNSEFKKQEVQNISEDNRKKICDFIQIFNEDCNLRGYKKVLKFENYIQFEQFYKNKSEKGSKNNLKEYKKIYSKFSKSFYNSMNDFIHVIDNKIINKKQEQLIQKVINNKETDKGNEIYTNIYKIYEEKESIKFNSNIIELLLGIIEELLELDNTNELIKLAKENFDIVKHFINKDRKIRIPIFGGYSTGKSSLLNSLIGEEILPTGSEICTKRGIVIRNNLEGKYIVYKTKFVKKDDYYYFEEGNIEIETNINEIEEIKKHLKNKIEETINGIEDSFLILSVPIEILKYMDLSQEILKRVEFIDFPGIDNGNNFIEESIFNPLINLSDTFIFVNPCNLISTEGNIDIIQKIITKIENRKFQFDFNSCLFILNQCDKVKDLSIKECKEEITRIIFEERDANSGQDYFDIINLSKNINLTKFSPKLYSNYLKFSKELDNFELFIKTYGIEVVKEEKETMGEEIENLILSVNNELCNHIEKNYNSNLNYNYKIENKNKYIEKLKEIFKKENISDDEFEKNKGVIDNIILFYSTELNNKTLYNQYISSNMDGLIIQLKERINTAFSMVNVQFKEKIKTGIYSLEKTFNILNFFLLSDGINSKSEDKNKETKILKMIEQLYNENLNESLNEINIFFGGIIKNFDNIFSEDINSSKMKKKYNAFKEKYNTEKKKLEEKIFCKLEAFQTKLEEIVDKTKNEFLFTFEDKNQSFSFSELITNIGLAILGVPVGAICLASLPFYGLGLLFTKIFKKDPLNQKKIENYKYSLYDSWKFSIYNIIRRYEYIKENSIKKIKIIYKSSTINIEPIKQKKEKFNKIYAKFKKLIEEEK